MTEPVNDALSSNLRRIREERRLSLDALARLTGVSKSLLAQIERGEANPTISTVWRITNGLKISFTQLVTRPEQDVEVVRKEEVPVLLEDGGRYRNYPLFLFGDGRKFEIYHIELDPGGFLQAEAHPQGTQELLYVYAGALEVCAGDEILSVEDGCGVRFRADQPHSYRNTGAGLCSVHMVISYI